MSPVKINAEKMAIPASANRMGAIPMPAGGGTGIASAIGTGGGVSTTGRTQPPFGAWAARESAALETAAPHNAAAEACDPKMLNATIGLTPWAVGVDGAEANAVLAQSERAAAPARTFRIA